MKKRLLWTIMPVAFTLLVSGTSAAQNDADIAAAENAYASLDYAVAQADAEAILAKGGLTHDVLVRATRVSALAAAASGDSDKAKNLFVTLLELDPEFKVDSKQGPRFSQPFAEARGFYLSKGRKGQLDVQATATFGQPVQVRTAVTDPVGIVKNVVIGYRWAPAREFTIVKAEVGTHTTDLPANPKGSTRLDYFVRARDAHDSAVFERGTADAPRTLFVTPARDGLAAEPKKSIFKSPILYIVGGVILTSAAISGYFLFRPTDFTAPTTARGALVANCGTERCN